MFELLDIEVFVQPNAERNADDCAWKSADREPPKDGDLHRPLLHVRDHGHEARPKRKEQVGTDGVVGTYSEEDEQRRRDSPRPDAAVRCAGSDDEADNHVAPVQGFVLSSMYSMRVAADSAMVCRVVSTVRSGFSGTSYGDEMPVKRAISPARARL